MKTKAIVIVTLIIIALTVVSAWQNRSQDVLAGVRDIAAAEIAAATGAAVQFGDIEVVSLTRLLIHNVYVYDKEAKLVGSSPKITVSYSPLSLFLGNKADMIRSLEVDKPQLKLTQKVSGRWNFEDLISESQTTPAEFSGKVILKDGQAEIVSTAGQWTLTSVNGSLDFSNQLSTGINISAQYNDTPLAVLGSLNTDGDGVFSVKARQLALADLKPLLPSQSSIQLLDGLATTVDATIKKKSGEITVAGQTEFSNVAAEIDSVPVHEASGHVSFTNEKLYIFAKAKVWEQPVAVRGKIALNTVQPVLDLDVSSEGFDPSVVKADLPVSGLVKFDAAVTGTADEIEVSGDVRLPEGQISGVALKNIAAQVHLAQNNFTISQLNGGLAGGRVSGSGVLNLNDNRYNVKINAQNVDSATLGQYLPGLRGLVAFDVAASGAGSNIEGALVSGTASITSGSYRGIAFDNAAGSFYLANNVLTVDYANLGVKDGMASASGTVSKDKIQLNVRGYRIPLELLGANNSNLKIAGMADFSGTINGTIAQPAAIINFTAVNGQALYQPFAHAQGQAIITPSFVTLTEIVLTDGPTTHRASGTIGLDRAQQLNLKISSRQARAENIVKLIAPGEKLTGNVDNDIIITGPLSNFNAEGKLKLTEGSFRGQLIASAQGSYRRENGLTSISDLLIKSLNTEVIIAGVVKQDQELDLAITARNLDISRFQSNLPHPVTGMASFGGHLTGTPQQPRFSGQLTAASLTYKNLAITNVNGDIRVIDNDIEIPCFKFEQGGGIYNFTGGLDLASGIVYGGLDVEKGDLAALFSLLGLPAKEVSGQMNGHIQLSGTMDRPNLWLTGGVTNGKIKNYQLDTIDIDAALDNEVVTVNKFFAKQGNGVLAVRGSADLNGPLNFEAGGRDIDAGLLTALFAVDVNVKGMLNFAAQVTGTALNPRADISLEISGGGVGSSTFDSLYGLLILQDNSININQLFVTKGPNRASAYGVIPVAALSSEGRRQATTADQMDVRMRLDQADLSILPLLTKEVDWAVGKTQGELTIAGTITQPYLTGSINVMNGTVKLHELKDPIQKVDLDIQFKGDKIILKTFSGRMGSGSYQMTGSTALLGLDFTDYNFQLNLDKIGVDSKYFKGPLSGNLELTSKRGRPLLAGTLLFEHDTIDIPFVTDFTESDLNVGLDIELIAGDKVRLYNPYMYDIWAEGRVKFAGSTKRPDPSGKFTAIRGTVSYLRTQFKVKEGSADFNQFGTFEPVLRLSASTKLHNTTVDLDIFGPVSAMDLRLTSEPAMNQQEIMSLLTLRSRYFERQNSGSGASGSGFGRDELVGLLDAGLQMRFVSEVEAAFRDAFGLDDFRVVRDTLWNDRHNTAEDEKESEIGREVYNLEMGKYVTDRLMLNYTQGLDNEHHSFGFRYDLDRRISLTGSVNDEDDRRIGIETRFRF
ncbi:MAG: translocation/assembly module TamB [Veillonellaceae bacterium]|nr:translocation/assembly module TamB [Veillonellaceae bacterium]